MNWKHKRHKNKEPQMYKDITIKEIINRLKHTHNWKSPGIDKITDRQNLLQKSLKNLKTCLTGSQKN